MSRGMFIGIFIKYTDWDQGDLYSYSPIFILKKIQFTKFIFEGIDNQILKLFKIKRECWVSSSRSGSQKFNIINFFDTKVTYWFSRFVFTTEHKSTAVCSNQHKFPKYLIQNIRFALIKLLFLLPGHKVSDKY